MKFDMSEMPEIKGDNLAGNYRELLEKYLGYTKWFVLSVGIFLIGAFLYVYTEVPKYNITSAILIKETEKGNSISDLADFEDFGLFNNSNKSLLNEIQVLKSRKIMTKVVKDLKVNVRYLLQDSPYFIEQFLDLPLVMHPTNGFQSIDNVGTTFEILILSADRYEFFDFEENSLGSIGFGTKFKANLGNDNYDDIREISIEVNPELLNSLIGKKVKVVIHPIDRLVTSLINRVKISPIDERNSEVLTISMEEEVVSKGKAIINNLIEQYNADGISDKNIISQATTDFLDDRLKLISTKLKAIESTAAQYKTNKGFLNAKNSTADLYMESSASAESELITANTQLTLVEFMMNELGKSNNVDPLPGNIGLSDPTTVDMIVNYNTLILQRNRILKSSTERNPLILNIDSQLEVLKNNLISSLITLRSSAEIQVAAFTKKSGQLTSKIASVPKFEREFKDIVREQETTNALYLFLLQKREESILSNAVGIEKAKIIDNAHNDVDPVSPNSMLIYIGALFLGIFFPISMIFLRDALDVKVHSIKDVSFMKLPFLGEVPLAKKSETNFLVSRNENTIVAEALRFVRTNINFILDRKDFGKVVFITSTKSGEGKSFIAANLATSFALSGKKTLLIGMDLRAPKLNHYFKYKSINGVSNYVKNSNLKFEDLIQNDEDLGSLDLIHSGDIPPNPVELLMSKRVGEIFERAKKEYDYIIVDTAPVGMVTDTLQIANFSDLTIYVIKSNFLDKRLLHIPENLNNENKLLNMGVLINGSDYSKIKYGYEYGYSGQKKKSWISRVFSMN